MAAGADDRRLRRFVRWMPYLTGSAGLTGLVLSVSWQRAVLVALFPFSLVVVGYGAWALLDSGGGASVHGLVRTLGAVLAWFWTAVGVICLIACSAWTVPAMLAAGAAVVVVRVVRSRRRKHRPWRIAEMMSWPGSDLALALHEATEEDLCLLWHLTGERLRAAHLLSTLEWIVEIRQLTLDELAARDPDGFSRWINGQPLTTDPRTYIGH
ncbi:hypothetical protein [Flindersiella endophytica]